MNPKPIARLFLLLVLISTSVHGLDFSKVGNAGRIDESIMVPMRDGIRLSTYIFHPQKATPPYPVILIRTPYFIGNAAGGWWADEITRFLDEGYAVIVQNERGKFWSEGEFTFLAGAREDGYDTLEWIEDQPWSNGSVGTFGCSSSAENQLPLMTMAHPAHKAAIPMSPAAGIGVIGPYHEQGLHYRGGARFALWAGWYICCGYRDHPKFNTAAMPQDEVSRLSRLFDLNQQLGPVDYASNVETLPLIDGVRRVTAANSDFEEFTARAPGSSEWSDEEFVNEGDQVGVPGLWIGSWFDTSRGPDLLFMEQSFKRPLNDVARHQYAVYTASSHCTYGRETENHVSGERHFGDMRYGLLDLWVDWFDHWLKGEANGVTDRSRYAMFLMGANEFRDYDSWPPQGVQMTRMYLSSTKGANSRLGDGALSPELTAASGHDEFRYDPHHPIRSVGRDRGKFIGLGPQDGSFDQSEQELRADMLVYTSEVLTEAVNVSGYINTVLFVGSDAPDTDFTIKLVDVTPDGKAWNVIRTMLRARYREGYDQPRFMEDGEVYRLELTPMVTSHLFQKGHRIRIEIASSDVPWFGRNFNTGGNNYDETEGVVARNRVYFGPEQASYIELPILD